VIRIFISEQVRPSLDALAKFWKAIISSVMSICLSIPREQLGSHWTDFYEI